jgi:hypothetical protein
VIAIHANWPAYPAEHGGAVALVSFGNFPRGTKFIAIDDIDRCVLLLAQGQTGFEEQPLDTRNFHIAAWHEDLLELASRGLVSGVHAVTELTWRWNQHRNAVGLEPIRSSQEAEAAAGEVPALLAPLDDGSYRRLPFPSADTSDDEDLEWVATDKSIGLTDVGWKELESLLGGNVAVPSALASRVEPMLQSGHYDSVVRELGAAPRLSGATTSRRAVMAFV